MLNDLAQADWFMLHMQPRRLLPLEQLAVLVQSSLKPSTFPSTTCIDLPVCACVCVRPSVRPWWNNYTLVAPFKNIILFYVVNKKFSSNFWLIYFWILNYRSQYIMYIYFCLVCTDNQWVYIKMSSSPDLLVIMRIIMGFKSPRRFGLCVRDHQLVKCHAV